MIETEFDVVSIYHIQSHLSQTIVLLQLTILLVNRLFSHFDQST